MSLSISLCWEGIASTAAGFGAQEDTADTDSMKKHPWIGVGKSGETDISIDHGKYPAKYFA